jgi:hypothetical protein
MATKKKTTKKRVARKKKECVCATEKTRIAIVLDRSSSMGVIQSATIDMFNEQITTIKSNAKGIDTKVSLFTFASHADEPTIFNAAPSKLAKLTLQDYRPNGMTAMYDGVLKAVNALEGLPESREPGTSFLIIVISDGQENYSRECTQTMLADRIKKLQGTGRWTFSYLGANQDLASVSRQLNIPLGNTMSWTASNVGTMSASISTRSATEQYLANRSMGIQASANFYQPQQAQEDADSLKLQAEALAKAQASKGNK